MTIQLLPGDCRDVLATLPANSVHCVVTSPPYLGLRDYGTAQWDGGDASCDHVAPWGGYSRDNGRDRAASGGTFHDSPIAKQITQQFRDICGKCGARRIDRQLGLERTPDEYLANMVAVFREIRRVLRSDGTCWVNMGDAYSSGGRGGGNKQATNVGSLLGSKSTEGMAPKQLLMMPSRLAIELQRDGWWLRSMMPWVRRNPMPESVTDRPGNAIEYVFMLTKKARYFWDATAVKRVQSAASFERFGNGKTPRTAPVKAGGSARKNDSFHAATPDAILPGGRSFRNSDLFYDSLEPPYGLICDADGTPIALDVNPAPFRESHFATFPPKLVEPLIRGATSERGCCAQCGKPWVRVIDCETRPNWQGDGQKHDGTYYRPNIGGGVGNDARARVDRGWSPSCKCGTTETRPATVLDPFAGAGTTLLVADRLQRDAIGIELNTAYTEMAMQRCRDDAPLFTSWPPAEDPADTRMADLFAEAAE